MLPPDSEIAIRAYISAGDDESLYDLVVGELEGGSIRRGLWAKALATCGGDPVSGRAAYVTLRVDQLKSCAQRASELLAARDALESQITVAEVAHSKAVQPRVPGGTKTTTTRAVGNVVLVVGLLLLAVFVFSSETGWGPSLAILGFAVLLVAVLLNPNVIQPHPVDPRKAQADLEHLRAQRESVQQELASLIG